MINKGEDFSIAISKEVVSQMPQETFSGEITVVSDASSAETAVRYLMEQPLVGFDTETRPSFRKGRINDVALMQIATDSRAFLFRLNLIGIEPVRPLIESTQTIKIGLSLKDDFQMLARRGETTPDGFVELQSMVRDYHITDASLQKVYAILFGRRISKAQRLTNWEASALSHGQQVYASLDAWACLEIYRYLQSGDFIPERSPYIKQPEPMPDATALTD